MSWPTYAYCGALLKVLYDGCMAIDAKPMDPERLAHMRDLVASFPTIGAAGGFLVAEMLELLADRDCQERERRAAESRADMFKARADRYEAVLAELPSDCWPEYEGAPRATAKLVDRARRADAAETKVKLHDDATMMLSRDFGLDGDHTRRHAVDAALVAAVRYRKALDEVTRLRARVREGAVEAEDVERSGLLDADVMRYLTARGWTLGHRYRRGDVDFVIMCLDGEPIAALAENEAASTFESIAYVIRDHARKIGSSPWDILDEMAAMPLEPA